MAELANRMDLEADFARRLSRLSSRQRKELIDLLGNPPDPAKVPESFWRKVEDERRAEMASILLLLFMAAGEQHVGVLSPDLRPATADGLRDAGTAWANQRAADVTSQFVANSQKRLASLAGKWHGPDFQIKRIFGDLKTASDREVLDDALDIFGPDRDANIAATETTQAQTAGTNGARGQIERFGMTTSVLWVTEKDGRVCPICSPLHRRPMSEWEELLPVELIGQIVAQGGPPAHVNCRCYLQVDLIRRGDS